MGKEVLVSLPLILVKQSSFYTDNLINCVFILKVIVAKSIIDLNKHFQRKIVNIFLPISFNICFGCSKEPSH